VSPVVHLLFANSSQSDESVDALLDCVPTNERVPGFFEDRILISRDEIFDIQLHRSNGITPVSSSSAGFSVVPSGGFKPSSGMLVSALSSAISRGWESVAILGLEASRIRRAQLPRVETGEKGDRGGALALISRRFRTRTMAVMPKRMTRSRLDRTTAATLVDLIVWAFAPFIPELLAELKPLIPEIIDVVDDLDTVRNEVEELVESATISFRVWDGTAVVPLPGTAVVAGFVSVNKAVDWSVFG
jgi:hypothetical protein